MSWINLLKELPEYDFEFNQEGWEGWLQGIEFALNLAKKRAKGTQTEDSDNEYYDDALKVVDEMRSHFLE
jgi:hypothetical protein